MESQKPNSFEEEWQRAFSDASFSPPSDMWDRIERELEEKKRRPFLFFMRPSVITAGVAAALILVLGGILYLNRNVADKTNVAENTVSRESTNVVENTNSKTSLKTNSKINSNTEIRPNIEDNLATNFNNAPSSTPVSTGNISIAKADFSAKLSTKNNTEKYSQKVSNTSFTDNNLEQKSSIAATQPIISAENTLVASTAQTTNLSLLNKKEYQYLGSRYTLNRNKLAFDAEIEETPILASNDSKFWVGVQSGVAPFDPNMKLGSLNTVALREADAFAQASNTPNMGSSPSLGDKGGNVVVSQPQNTIKAGIGTNTGIAFGYKIAKKWNLESGIRYLRGNSTLQTNTYAFQQNGYVNTFLGDYLLQNSGSTMKVNNAPINTVVADASQFGNRYEYLMIPMQLGYEIGLTKKLGLNLLAGVSADLFLQNTITNDKSLLQEKSIINSSNNIYKPLNISGLGGIRANYLISKHWQLNLGSSFQQSLFSGINSSTALQMRLKIFGLNYGVNFRF